MPDLGVLPFGILKRKDALGKGNPQDGEKEIIRYYRCKDGGQNDLSQTAQAQ
jgi:hypothetical protein